MLAELYSTFLSNFKSTFSCVNSEISVCLENPNRQTQDDP